MSEQELEQLRQRIDALDTRLQLLISERASLAGEVAAVKQRQGGEGDCYRPAREAEVLRAVIERNEGPLDDETLARIFREIMAACLALESPLRVAFLGPEGTFTQAAVHKHFGHAVDNAPLSAIDEVFREVESGNADYGVVPVENSTEGVVTHTLDMFTRSRLHICGEVMLPVHHCLLADSDGMDAIQRIYAHSQSLAQCREWLDAHLPGVERIAVSSNGEAARRVAGEADSAAIASRAAAEIHDLNLLAENIEDEPDNTTRFLVIGRVTVPPTGQDKTSLLVSAPNRPGALHGLIEPFSRHGVSMTRIESRPSRRAQWDYVFFLDVEGHVEDSPLAKALAEVESRASLLRVLGSYPAAVY